MQSPSRPSPADFTGAHWRKSSRSQGTGGECVEVARIPGLVGVRDSKDPAGPALVFEPAALRALAAQIKRGEHHL
ncbi:DUF397 domain-containing protein [Spirillospora sp. NPDC000708]